MADGQALEGLVKELRAQCAAVGFELDQAHGALLERIRLLGEGCNTFDDAVRMSKYALRIFEHYERTKPVAVFTPMERRTVVLAALFSDIGKTGPLEADADARRLVVEMFAVENVRDDTQSVTAFLRTHFPSDAEDRIARFGALGLDAAMSIRQFWNLHSEWTLAIAEAAGIPPEAAAAAATHHLLDNVNPGSIVGDDARFTRAFGDNASFDRAEKLVIVLDKYDAARRRGRLTHDQAIAWLRDRIAQSPRFCEDVTLRELVGDADVALRALGAEDSFPTTLP
jgi:hypothetical protein